MPLLPPQTLLRIPGSILSKKCNEILKNLSHCIFFASFVFTNYCSYLVILLNSYTREIFPEGLPPSYVFVATLRLKGPSSKLTFDLWRVQSKDKEIQAAVTLSGKDKTVSFTTTSLTEKEQRVILKAGFQVCVRFDFDVHTRLIREDFLTCLLAFFFCFFLKNAIFPICSSALSPSISWSV